MRLITRLLGGSAEPPAPLPAERLRSLSPAGEPAASTNSTREAAEALEQALNQVESMLGEVEQRAQAVKTVEGVRMQPFEADQLGKSLHEALRRLDEALDLLSSAGQRLAGEVTRLSQLADRLDTRVEELTGLLSESREAVAAEPELVEKEPVPLPVQEPAFQAGDQPVRVIIANVPGFQGLMDAQRALSGLVEVEGASVKRYQNGEALLEVGLQRPLSSRQIVDSLEQVSRRSLLIEEARPEGQLLRLRFLDADG